ncbi:MAG: ATP-binding protein [Candidatus Dormibacter sp.]
MQPELTPREQQYPDEPDQHPEPALLRDVLDALPVGIGLFGADAEDFVFVHGNREFTRLLALDEEPRSGQLLDRVFDRGQRDAVMELFRRVKASREPRSYFSSEGAEAGEAERIWNLDAYPVHHGSGAISHIMVLVQETREKAGMRQRQEREANRLRAKADQLADLEKAKSEFLHLASHELRGPAAMLRGYLSMIEDGSLGTLPPKMMPILPVLKAKAAQINMLANEMVEAARLEDRRLQLKLKRVNLLDAVRRSMQSVQATMTPKHRMTLEDQAPGGLFVLADVMRLDIIIGNLLDNAVKYSPDGGDIVIRLAPAGGMALLSVRDHGIGIAPEDMERLFVRFCRLAPRSDVPGTGLGLYLARELARLHGGDIVAVSRPGEGSEFTLSLPLDPAKD